MVARVLRLCGYITTRYMYTGLRLVANCLKHTGFSWLAMWLAGFYAHASLRKYLLGYLEKHLSREITILDLLFLSSLLFLGIAIIITAALFFFFFAQERLLQIIPTPGVHR